MAVVIPAEAGTQSYEGAVRALMIPDRVHREARASAQ
jgi:hypothetical protein